MINESFTKLMLAYFLSVGGDWVVRLAIPILIYQQTHSPLAMSVAYALLFVPFLVITPFSGILADKFNRHSLLILSDFSAFVFTLSLSILTNFYFSLEITYILLFLISSSSSIYHTAFHSLLPALVQYERLSKANSFIVGVESMVNIIGPIFGGSLISILGVLNVLYLNALIFLLSTLILYSFSFIENKNNKSSNYKLNLIIKEIKEGIRYTWTYSIIKYSCILFIFSNFAINLFYSNFMFYLINILSLNSTEIGLTIAIIGSGAAIGAFIAPFINHYLSEGRLILICTSMAGLISTFLLFTNHYIGVAITWAGVSLLNTIIIVSYFTLRQKLIPQEILGRVIATTRWISYLAIPASSLFSGWLLQQSYSIYFLISLCAIIMSINGLFGWFTPLRQ